ncbi:hypothetical protein PIB30_027156 [Stylosanthes scabra]|uniref:Uncharacterized protein n=1 Tax=Stylosanthes scabra TaxID=79078 RepID=A0ABU6Z7E6_9FABA|nr:hypothetical protein [Stylosanthes scabra]
MNSLHSTESIGYGWSISAWQFWNGRGTPEAQRFAEVSRAFTSCSSIWFHLWSLWNPNPDWDTFDLAFLHQFEPAMHDAKLVELNIGFGYATGDVILEEDADSDSTNNLAMNSSIDQQVNFTRSFHKSTIGHNEIDAEDAKLERAEIKEQSPTLLDTEESDGGTIPGNGCTQHPTSGAAVDAVKMAKEEEAHRPPPKPPNLSSEWVLTDETTVLRLKSAPETSPSKATNVTAGDSNNALVWRQRHHGENEKRTLLRSAGGFKA